MGPWFGIADEMRGAHPRVCRCVRSSPVDRLRSGRRASTSPKVVEELGVGWVVRHMLFQPLGEVNQARVAEGSGECLEAGSTESYLIRRHRRAICAIERSGRTGLFSTVKCSCPRVVPPLRSNRPWCGPERPCALPPRGSRGRCRRRRRWTECSPGCTGR